jgi:hypothetical protein
VKERVEGESLAQTHFPASGAGSLFLFMTWVIVCGWCSIKSVIKNFYKIAFKAFFRFGRESRKHSTIKNKKICNWLLI